MEQVYITGIIVGGFIIVLITVSLIFRNRLQKGKIRISRDEIEGSLENEPNVQSDLESEPKQLAKTQKGKTVIERVKSFWSRIRAPRDADIKVRDTTFFGSELDIYTPDSDSAGNSNKGKKKKSGKKRSKKGD